MNGRVTASSGPLSPVSTTPTGARFNSNLNIKGAYAAPSSLAGGPRSPFNPNAELRRSPSIASNGSGGSNTHIGNSSANGVTPPMTAAGRLHALGPLRTNSLANSPYAQRSSGGAASSLDHATAAYGAPLARRRTTKKVQKTATFSGSGPVSVRSNSPGRRTPHAHTHGGVNGNTPVRATTYANAQYFDQKEPSVHVLNPSTSRAQLQKQPSLPPMSEGDRKGLMDKLAAVNGNHVGLAPHPSAISNANGHVNGNAHHRSTDSKDLRVAITPPVVTAEPPVTTPSTNSDDNINGYYGMEAAINGSGSSSAADDAASAAAIAAAKRDRWVPPSRDKRVSGVASGIASGGRKEMDPIAAAAAVAAAALQAAADEAPRQQSRLNGSRATLLTTTSSNESMNSGLSGSSPTDGDSLAVTSTGLTARTSTGGAGLGTVVIPTRAPADLVELTLTLTVNLPTPSPLQHHAQVAVFTRDGSSYTPAGLTEAIPLGQNSFTQTIPLRVRAKQLLRVALFDPPTNGGTQPDEAELVGESLLAVTKLTASPSVTLALKKDAKAVTDVQIVIASVAPAPPAVAVAAAVTPAVAST